MKVFKFTVRELRVPLGSSLEEKLQQALGLEKKDILGFRVIRKSIDARGKAPKWVYNLEVELSKKPRQKGIKLEEGWKKPVCVEIKKVDSSRCRVVVVGFGPAGIFSSLLLSEAGVFPVVIERGRPMKDRERDVESIFGGGVFSADSNVLFGEGGAGAFSDGKLTTRIRSPFVELFKKFLVRFGVSPDIFTLKRPHIGTDGVRKLVVRIRTHLVERGVSVNFSEKLVDIFTKDGRVVSILTNKREIFCDFLILATGHSARDVYELLRRKGVSMVPKTFSVGLRVEHPSDYVDSLFYGKPYPHLPHAEYQLSCRFGKRGVYTFCMCPGGYVINASSEEDGLNVNGMSYSKRDGKFSNSAVCVNVFPEDIEGDDPLKGVHFQRFWEKKAFSIRGDFTAPSQNLLDFVEGTMKRPVFSTYRPGVFQYPLKEILPGWACEFIKKGLMRFDEKVKGFVSDAGTLVGPEMRTSSPVRILRKDSLESVSLKGLFPVGEGSGYAGGIVSSAVDGMKVASSILREILGSDAVVFR